MTSRTCVLAGILIAAGIGCSREAAAPAAAPAAAAPPPWTLTIQPLELASAASSSQSQLTTSSRGTLVSWVEQEDQSILKFSELTAQGWSEPRVAGSGADWFVTDADTPAVIRLSSGALVADWMQSSSDEFEASNLRLSYSTDEAKTWSRSFLPHRDGTITQHAFATLFEMPDKGLGVVWLDGRQTVKDREHGPMSLRFASFDGQWKQRADAAIDTKVCDCCTTSVAITPDGPVTVYRDRTDNEIRDIYVSRFESGKWTPGVAVHDDGWKINACPVNGPAVSAVGRNVAVAWFTTLNDEGRAFAALSTDGGRTWGNPIRLDEAGALGHVDIEMLDDGSAVATWEEFANQRGQFRTRRVEAAGATSPAIVIAGAANGRVSGVPRLARSGDQLVFAWTEAPERGGLGRVKTARATLPH
jgi:hypothetical protein